MSCQNVMVYAWRVCIRQFVRHILLVGLHFAFLCTVWAFPAGILVFLVWCSKIILARPCLERREYLSHILVPLFDSGRALAWVRWIGLSWWPHLSYPAERSGTPLQYSLWPCWWDQVVFVFVMVALQFLLEITTVARSTDVDWIGSSR